MIKDYEERLTYFREYMKQRWRNRRLSAIVKLGGCCVHCGSQNELEFDHINPEDKLFSIAKGSSYSEEKFQEELSKCQLLCKKCHIIKTTQA